MKKLFKIFIVLGLAIGLSTGIALAADENILPESVSALGEITLTDEGWGAGDGYTATYDCDPDYEGWGDDWWILNLSTPRDVEITVRDSFIVGDFFEVHVQPVGDDDCIIGVTPKPEEGDPYSTGTFVVSLEAGSYLIRVRDAAFADDPWLCPAGYYVTIALSDYTDIPWPCDGDIGEVLDALEAKLDGLAGLPGMIEMLGRAVAALEAKSDAIEAKLDETSVGMQEKLDAIEAKLDNGAVITQDDLAAGQGGVWFMGAKNQPKPTR